MSGFMFATCNKQMALRHLRLAYPGYEITEEDVIKIMPYIEKDIVRIQDPEFHSPPQVVAGSNWVEDEEKRKQISKDFKEFQDSLKKRL